MRIGLQFAMPAELHALPGARDLEPFETVSGVPFFEAAPDILACAGGVGKVNAAMSAEILCLKYGVDLILNAGVGGLCRGPAHRQPGGGLGVRAARRGHHCRGRSHRPGVHGESRRSSPPGSRSGARRSCAPWARRPSPAGWATGDWFAVKGPRAAWIRDTFFPLLAEMEGGAIAQVCLRNHIRFVSVKSVSDHLFTENQAEEYFDFGQALEALGAIVLPLARALQKEESL